jgi:hypothetical protein
MMASGICRHVPGGSMKHAYQRIAAFSLVMFLSPAFAQGVGRFVDTANFSMDFAAGTEAIGGASNQRLAQTLTVEIGGTLEGVFVPVSCSSGHLVVEIHDVVSGQPGPTVLAHRSVAAAQLMSNALHFTFVPIPGALPLAPGQNIAIVLDSPHGTCGCLQSQATSDYPAGHGFFEALPNPPGWIPFSTFPGTPDDIPFQLVVS